MRGVPTVKKSDRALVLHDDQGQTMTEYVIILGVITLGILLAMGVLSTAIVTAIEEVVALIP
jgi:Flp pilus assembly pilin Flp